MEDNTDIRQENDVENTEDISEKAPEKRGSKILNDIMEIMESTLITIFVIVMIFTYLLHPVDVQGTSMVPTLNNGDKIFMSTIYTDINYGDIIIINNDTSYLLDDNGEVYAENIDKSSLKKCIIKRVIACEGQEINIDNSNGNVKEWTVSVDGKILDEPYIAENAVTDQQWFSGKFPFVVPEGYYFVMGDNRSNSSDSRHHDVGLIKKDQIQGKAIVRYSPFSEFKFLMNSWKKSSDD
ncbi:MAG: signal peptidase I [Ruminococcus sp.]|nr:signal peptidase I [Ruminococcus sp.]